METCNSCSSGELPKGCKNNGACGTGNCNSKLSVFNWLSDIHPPILKNHPQYIEVRFKDDRKDFYINDSKLNLCIGDIVAVEANSGHDVGIISLTGELVKIQMRKKKAKIDELFKVYRKASQKDIEIWQNYKNKEHTVMLDARKIARSLGLQMKICNVEYQGDGSKVTLYYTAEGRVDFRQLIKDYAMAFRSKIDMRQIGYRQESAKVGGIGSCGRELCCSTWLTDFRSVNTAAARYQQLSINPQKLAGQCGKLKCCLNFELDTYVDALADFPSSQTVLETEKGKAYCIKVDVFRNQMWFTYTNNSISWHPINIYEVKKLVELNEKGIIIKPLDELQEKEELKVDLIEENNLHRFEKRSKSNTKRKSKNKSQQRTNSKNTNTAEKPKSRTKVNNNSNQQKKRPPKKPK
jgi:cell fate regulator YaaT (PSP1 superfamily)